MIKGIEGNDYFRIAVHGKHEDELALEAIHPELREKNKICYTENVKESNFVLSDLTELTLLTGGRR